MKTLKLKSILFSLMALFAVAVMITSCGQTEIAEPVIERMDLQEPTHNYTASETQETYRIMDVEAEGLDFRNSCYAANEELYFEYADQYANNPTNYNLYSMNHYYINYLINYVNCCTEPECGEILGFAYDAYVAQYNSDAIHNPACDQAQLIWELYIQLHTICSC